MVWMFVGRGEEGRGSCLIHRESWRGGCRCLASAGQLLSCREGQWGCRGREAGEDSEWVNDRARNEGGELGLRGQQRSERKDSSVFGQAGEIGGGGRRQRERATRSSGDQSIGRFSPCFFVNSSAFFKNFLRSFEYSSARSALRGCSGWGSFTSAIRDWITAGRHKQKNTWEKLNETIPF